MNHQVSNRGVDLSTALWSAYSEHYDLIAWDLVAEQVRSAVFVLAGCGTPVEEAKETSTEPGQKEEQLFLALAA
ncbi:MAG: hypothetical protein WC767_03150 [Candidatus Paceibacterota bacterium]